MDVHLLKGICKTPIVRPHLSLLYYSPTQPDRKRLHKVKNNCARNEGARTCSEQWPGKLGAVRLRRRGGETRQVALPSLHSLILGNSPPADTTKDSVPGKRVPHLQVAHCSVQNRLTRTKASMETTEP